MEGIWGHYADCRVNCPMLGFDMAELCDEHDAHWCNCDDIARSRAENYAEAAAEHLAEIGLDSPPPL